MDRKTLAEIHSKLTARGKTIAAAESCSGGLLSAELTRLPGASKYFIEGLVTYSNSSKEKVLRVPNRLIRRYGAVSRQVAVSMAKNIRTSSRADLGVSITGIAGPEGGRKGKPVGTVFICVSSAKKNTCLKFSFRGTRQKIRTDTVQEALRLLCAHLSP
ncbi:MAG: nicotinamide-nucleotide amidohydrolase family protein [Candidatus Omnitrophica bacterium]|nr:nicotinamide-nucleotide amidohydrolase family protein [Candidatus Omnitrophota bacterium]MDD5042073.1 nicotinamide-nucleotide amidohydrolase family protein [Candidatus Omnitrophota bacterium]MDD5500265.1 nicotinamide-nucleotide amidohydrolase family protein [Candidatus Omnitrophota bacterium]